MEEYIVMGENSKPLDELAFIISGSILGIFIIALLLNNPLGGFILGSVLFYLWVSFWRLILFVTKQDGVIIGQYTNTPSDTIDTSDEPSSGTMSESSEFFGRTSPSQDVGVAVSRIIGADVRKRVMCTETTRVRNNISSNSEPRDSEDRDFAYFLHGGPF